MQHLIVLLANPGGTFNSGDVLLQQSFEECLRSCGTLLVQSDSKDITRSRSGRYCEILSINLALLKVALRARLVHDSCATLMLPLGQSLTKSLTDAPRVAQQLVCLGLMRVLGVRVVSLGRDFSSTAWINRLQEVGLSHVAHQYTLRDEAALRRARAVGIRRAAWFPDLSWLAPISQSSEAFAERSSVVLSFRSDTDRLRWDEGLASAILDNIGGFLDEAHELGIKTVLLVEHANQDQAITMQIERRYQRKYHLRRVPGLLSLSDIPRVYGKAALVLSNRLHSLLLGLQWGAVPLALIHGSNPEKVRNQLLDINLAAHIVDLAAPALGRGIVERALSRQNEVKEAVATYRLKAISTARETLAALFNSDGRKGPLGNKIDTHVLCQQLYDPTSIVPSAS